MRGWQDHFRLEAHPLSHCRLQWADYRFGHVQRTKQFCGNPELFHQFKIPILRFRPDQL